jgi:uncharacterized protein
MAKVEGSETLSLPPAEMWSRLNDADALASAIPGCSGFTELAPGRFETSIAVAVGPVHGIYDGTVEYADVEEPVRCTIVVAGRGDRGAIAGQGAITLAAMDGGTEVSYTGTFKLSGPIAGVGQRLAPGISRRMIVETLRNLERGSEPSCAPDAGAPVDPPAAASGRGPDCDARSSADPRSATAAEAGAPPFRPLELAPWQVFALGLAIGALLIVTLRRRR